MIRLFKNHDGTAAVETAIVVPLFFVFALGIADVGGGVFTRMTINAAAQAGAAYAATHPAATLSDIKTAMIQAAANSLFCTGPLGSCTATLQSACAAAPTPCVVTVTATHAWTPWLPEATYSWALSMSISYTATIRVS